MKSSLYFKSLKWYWICLFIACWLVMGYDTPFAQQLCNPYIKPVEDGRLGYQVRENDKRCEGFYKAEVAAGNIEIVGLIKGGFNFKLDNEEVVSLSSPFVKNQPVYACAMAIPVKTYYRMDARIDPNQNLRWSLKDVICPK